jgi:DMSO/TMAO reductase YedYZ molybdopterin-dependent catalytic subunit
MEPSLSALRNDFVLGRPDSTGDDDQVRSRIRYATYGLIAAIVAVAVGDLLAAMIDPAASPVLAVGSQVIDLTPTPVKEWAISWFGTADKAILVGSVLAGTIALAAAAGVISRDRPPVGAAILGGMGLLVAAIALSRDGARPANALPALATAPVAIGVLLGLRKISTVEAATESPSKPLRRTLLASTGLLVLAAVLGAGGSALRRRGATPVDIALPKPERPLPALPRGLGQGITPFTSPNRSFYRIDTTLSVPIVDPDTWSLTIDGDVGRKVRYSYADLLAMDLVERDITLACVSNPVGGPYAGGARWLGVPLAKLLKPAASRGSRPWGKADQILSTDVDGMTISTPLDLATDGRDSMIAIGMNGEPLPREHGFPARLIVPGLYGFIGATKWVTRLTLTTYAAQSAYWTDRGWATDAPIKIASRIDTPHDGDHVDPGDVIVGGIAWAHSDGGVDRVQVRVDDGEWHDAHIGPTGGANYWRQWFWRWPAKRGEYRLSARAVGADGTVQTGKEMEPFPEGATGFHSVSVTVA